MKGTGKARGGSRCGARLVLLREVAAHLCCRQSQTAEFDLVPGLEATSVAVQVQDGRLDLVREPLLQGAQTAAARGALDAQSRALLHDLHLRVVEVPGEDERDHAVRPAGRVRLVGHRDVDRGAEGLLVADGRGQLIARQLLGRAAVLVALRAVRGERRVADTREAQPTDGDRAALVQDVHVLHALQIALGELRVVVAADPDVRGPEIPDRVQETVLRRRPVVHRVAGVDDDVDLVLLHQRRDDLPARGVEMDVRDVQDPDRGRVGLIRRQRGRDVVQLRHVRHQARQLLLVDVEFGDDAARVAHQGRGRGEKAGEPRLQDRLGVPGRVRRRSRRHQEGEGQAAGRQGAAGAAVDREAEGGGSGHDGHAGTYGQVEGAVSDVLGDLVLEAGETFGVVDQGLGAHRVQLVDVDVEADRAGVAAQFEGAQRRDVDLRAAGERGAQGHRGVHRTDRRAYVAYDQQPEPGTQDDHRHQSQRAGPGVRRMDQLGGRMRAPGAVVAGEGGQGAGETAGGGGTGALGGRGGGGYACHWSRMPKVWCGYAGAILVRPGPRRSYGRSVPDNGRVLEMTREEFEELVAEALDRIPPELTRLMDNVAVFVEDEPPRTTPSCSDCTKGHR